MGRSRRLRSTAEGIGAPKRENKLENLMFKGRDMNVMVRKGDRRSGGRVGLAAEAGPVSRSFDLQDGHRTTQSHTASRPTGGAAQD